MSNDLTIRRATPEDADAIRELLRVCLGEGSVPRTQAYWDWKHEHNPFGASPVLVAEDEGQLVGLRTFMRWTWVSGTEEVSAVRAVDTATHPDYRGRGIFRMLTTQLRDEMEEEGVGMVFNTPNDKSRPGYLKMGWQLVGRPTVWMKPVRPVRLVKALKGQGMSGAEGEPPVIEAETASEALGRPDVLGILNSLRAPLAERYHTAITKEYLLWRYGAAPNADYHIASRGSGAEGSLIAMRSRRRGDFRELRVCDVAVGPTPEARRNARRLLRGAGRLADVDAVVVMATPEADGRSLALSGYLPAIKSGPVLTAYPLALPSRLPAPSDLGHWAASIGAFELF